MRIHFRSDVHFEVNKGIPYAPYPEADVIVLAGDIEDQEHAKKLAIERPQTHVIVVLGNHDYWYTADRNVDTGHLDYSDASLPNLHVLENSSCTINGHRFIGCCLWGNGGTGHGDAQRLRRGLNDFAWIKHGWSPEKMRVVNQQSRAFLVGELEKGDKSIVITHFPPMTAVQDPQYANDPLTQLYYSAGMDLEIDRLMRAGMNPPLWIFGHSHATTDVTLGGTRFMSNCRGYEKYDDCKMDENLIIEI